MINFGEIINRETPVLICFYKDELSEKDMKTISDVAFILKNKVYIIRIDITKNKLLAENLGITETPIFSIYHKGELRCEHQNDIEAIELMKLLQQYI